MNTPLAAGVLIHRSFLGDDLRSPDRFVHPTEVCSTMRHPIALGASLAVALLVSCAYAEEGLKSGPQVGSKRIPAFNPLHCNTESAGTKACLV